VLSVRYRFLLQHKQETRPRAAFRLFPLSRGARPEREVERAHLVSVLLHRLVPQLAASRLRSTQSTAQQADLAHAFGQAGAAPTLLADGRRCGRSRRAR